MNTEVNNTYLVLYLDDNWVIVAQFATLPEVAEYLKTAGHDLNYILVVKNLPFEIKIEEY